MILRNHYFYNSSCFTKAYRMSVSVRSFFNVNVFLVGFLLLFLAHKRFEISTHRNLIVVEIVGVDGELFFFNELRFLFRKSETALSQHVFVFVFFQDDRESYFVKIVFEEYLIPPCCTQLLLNICSKHILLVI